MKENMKKVALDNLGCFAIIALCVFVSNLIINFKAGNDVTPFACLPTLLLLAAVSFAGVLMKAAIKVKSRYHLHLHSGNHSLPPRFPWYQAIITMLGNLQFNAVMTPILAFTGLSVGKDVGAFLKAGPKLLVVSICVFIGTYLGSALISQLGLLLTGQL